MLAIQQSKPAAMPAAKAAPKPALFKDYNKATKDLINKQYTAPGVWKMECKFKGPVDQFYINPQVSSNSRISADIEYVTSCGGSAKVTLTPEDLDDIKATGVYNYAGHRIEAVATKKGGQYDCEVMHETCLPLAVDVSINEKITRNNVEVGIGAAVAPGFQIGCGAIYNVKGKDCNWTIGGRYAAAGYEIAITTNRLKTYNTTASIPVTIPIGGPRSIIIAAETTCGYNVANKWHGTIGVETNCPMIPANKLKARVDRNKAWAIAYVVSFADKWTMAVSVDASKKAGVLLTHS